MKKPAIPDIPPMQDPATRRALMALKDNVETITGRRGKKVAVLSSGATLEQAVAKLNELITWLQD